METFARLTQPLEEKMREVVCLSSKTHLCGNDFSSACLLVYDSLL
jgi:hypothetical protein